MGAGGRREERGGEGERERGRGREVVTEWMCETRATHRTKGVPEEE